MSWSVIVPLKELSSAKSRLSGNDSAISNEIRVELALAFILDTVDAVRNAPSTGEVIVVTDDDRALRALAPFGVVPVAETEPGSDARPGLNPAILRAVDAARRDQPGSGIAVVTGDVPALTADAFQSVLTEAETLGRSFVPDAEGTGTTMLLTPAHTAVSPRFGAGSRAAHEAEGYLAIDRPVHSGVRRDVDTQADLEQAIRLGVGRHTRAALATLDVIPA